MILHSVLPVASLQHFDQASIDFQEKILHKSALSQETFFPPGDPRLILHWALLRPGGVCAPGLDSRHATVAGGGSQNALQ